jgi:hypothetical protein
MIESMIGDEKRTGYVFIEGEGYTKIPGQLRLLFR